MSDVFVDLWNGELLVAGLSEMSVPFHPGGRPAARLVDPRCCSPHSSLMNLTPPAWQETRVVRGWDIEKNTKRQDSNCTSSLLSVYLICTAFSQSQKTYISKVTCYCISLCWTEIYTKSRTTQTLKLELSIIIEGLFSSFLLL